MSALLDALDPALSLARSQSLWKVQHVSLESERLSRNRWPPFDTYRCQFGICTPLMWKASGSCDDSLYERNLWPCRDSQCRAVLGPLDAIELAEESNVENERCCLLCGTVRSSFALEDVLSLLSHMRRRQASVQ